MTDAAYATGKAPPVHRGADARVAVAVAVAARRSHRRNIPVTPIARLRTQRGDGTCRREAGAAARAAYDVPMRPALIAPLLLACTLLAACAGTPHALAAGGVTFIVVRHAEKVDASRDPDLSPAGHARAQALAQRLGQAPLAAAYVTEFKRTGQTLAPSVQARGLVATAYAAAEPAATFAARLRAAHPRGVVLIAGHSNTVPDIVAALCACSVAPMPDHEYDRLSLIRIDAGGTPSLSVQRYGAATPAPATATAAMP